MSYLRSMKTKQFLKFLKARGVEIIKNRGNGGHYLVKLNGRQTTVPMHGVPTMPRSFWMIFASSSIPVSLKKQNPLSLVFSSVLPLER